MKPLRLRTQLTLWSALVTGLALLTFSGGAALSFYFAQVKGIDRRMTTDAKEFLDEPDRGASGELAELVRNRPKFLFGGSYHHGSDTNVFSDSKPVAEWLAGPAPKEKFSNVRIGEKHLRVGTFGEPGEQVVLAADLWPALDPVFDLLGADLLALPFVLLVVAAGSGWIARRALRPVDEVSRAAAAITAERLDARLTGFPVDDELGRLTRVLNAMFDRLQRSFEQASRFSADASHELRTPLTILRGEIEEALRAGGFTGEQERVLVSLLEQTGGLQKIADNLLLLARFDAGKAPLQRGPVDFSAMVTEVAEDAELLAAPARITVQADIASGVLLTADPVLLRRLLLNLIDNAVRYNRPDGEVRLILTRAGPNAVFTLRNTGPGIPAEKHGELFQRFFRMDDDRSRGTGGSGLGLSLCREIVTAHGGVIALSRADTDWTEFTVRLP